MSLSMGIEEEREGRRGGGGGEGGGGGGRGEEGGEGGGERTDVNLMSSSCFLERR